MIGLRAPEGALTGHQRVQHIHWASAATSPPEMLKPVMAPRRWAGGFLVGSGSVGHSIWDTNGRRRLCCVDEVLWRLMRPAGLCGWMSGLRRQVAHVNNGTKYSDDVEQAAERGDAAFKRLLRSQNHDQE